MSDHPADCQACSRMNGDCELQEMAVAVGLSDVRYGVGGQYGGAHHLNDTKDESNPYFAYDPAKCIVCYRCVRACEETQGTFALTVSGRGFESRIVAEPGSGVHGQRMRQLRRVRAGVPDGFAAGKELIMKLGLPEHSVITTCAYCGVGCGFRAEMKGSQVVNMVPWKDGKANEGHSCVKGRFAWGYATHKDRITKPMIRKKISDPWQEVSWDEAINYAAAEFKRLQATYGKDSIGGITSSRCTNEETYLVQKLVRAAFGNNNVDTCARVCHSPTGYGLGQTFGTSAGTQTFKSVEHSDVIMIIGANPTDAHPVFASRMRRRLREGAKLIIVDPRKIDLVRLAAREGGFPPAAEARHQCRGHHRAGARGRHRRAAGRAIHRRALRRQELPRLERIRRAARELARSIRGGDRRAGGIWYAARRVCLPTGNVEGKLGERRPNSAIYYGLGVTEHAQGSTMVMGIANLAMATGNVGREGVGVNPLRGQNNVQGSCDMGSFPHELPGYRHISDTTVAQHFRCGLGRDAEPRAGPAHSEHVRRRA